MPIPRGARRIIVASAVAPLIAPLLYWLGLIAAVLADPGRRNRIDLTGAAASLSVAFAVGAPVAYVATVCAGLPLLWLLRRFGTLTLYRTLLVGALVGTVVALIVQPFLRGELFSVLLAPWQGAVLGVGSAAAWWRLALR